MNRVFRNIPNFITCLRIVFLLLLFYFFFRGQLKNSLWMFFFAAVSDYFDGYLARRFHLTTRLGSLLDPLCDKVFCLSIFTLLMAYDLCPPWFLGLFIASTLLQVAGWLVLRGPAGTIRPNFSPLPLGKVNTALQMFWMGAMLIDLCYPEVRVGAPGIVAGYALLSVLQIGVFFGYFSRVRPRIARHFTPTSA